jgi:hypothetical protein
LFYRIKKQKKMKKVAFMFVAAMAISFASCGGQTAANTECEDSACCEAAEEIVEEVADTVPAAADSVAAEVLAD